MKLHKAILFLTIIVTIMFSPLLVWGQLISPRSMERFGLIRIWYNQLAVNDNNSKLKHITVEGDTLFALSTDAKLHAIDISTGKLLWSKVVGKRELQYYAPVANSRIVAVASNIELFAFDRKNGKLLFYTPLPNSVAVTACAISENYVYIPLLGGRIIVYPLEEGILEKTFNMKTGEYDDVIPVFSKSLASAEQTAAELEASESIKTKNKIEAMKAKSPNDVDKRDETIAGIVEDFAQTKHSILAKPEIPPQSPQFVLRPALNFPMTTITFGDLTIQPQVSTQIMKIDAKDNTLKMHWEILTWINKDGDFHSSIIRDLSQTKIEQLYCVSSPTKIFRPEKNQIAERDWKIDKKIVARPTTNQTVPYFYSGINFGRDMIPDLSVLGTKLGYVFAIKNRNGEVAWHFVANGAVTEQIAVVGVDVFASTNNGMYNINILTGKEKWYVPNINKFVCASKARVYTQDKNGFLVILNRKNGSRIASLDLRKFQNLLFNIETDRLFVVDNSGLIQCFAERQTDASSETIRYGTRSIPEIRHRLSASQYAELIRGKEMPDLYWVTELGLNGKNTAEDTVKFNDANKENIDNTPNVESNINTNNATNNSSADNSDTNNTVDQPAQTTTETTETPDSKETTESTDSPDSTETTETPPTTNPDQQDNQDIPDSITPEPPTENPPSSDPNPPSSESDQESDSPKPDEVNPTT
ncbi:MAG: PQQ-binding-like beta-propeller repeat protein [Planctomycetaceae bacterium]|jgi:hypothetical protein|nr:PQQ-binding-like beta-propeller repeat protein [Planctomycetaceae bacterium]